MEQIQQANIKTSAVQRQAETAQTSQKPGLNQTTQSVKLGKAIQPVQKKPKKGWIFVVLAILIIGGGIWAYFQFLN